MSYLTTEETEAQFTFFKVTLRLGNGEVYSRLSNLERQLFQLGNLDVQRP